MGARPHSRPLVRVVVALLPIGLALGGCGSEEENLKPDEGVSPFFVGKAQSPDGTQAVRPLTKPGSPARGAEAPGDAASRPAPAPSAATGNAFSFEELDKLNKTAMSFADKGQFAAAAKAFDQVLGAEPQNRIALVGRATVGTEMMDQMSEQDRISEIGHAADLMRTLKKAYKTLQPREKYVIGIILFNEATVVATQGQADKCLEILKEAVDEGFKRWHMMVTSPALDGVRKDPRFTSLLAQVKAASLKEAREGAAAKRIDQGANFPFTFDLKTPDGKPLSSADLKGKIVLVDFWGTWCGPCISTIPHLVEMHQKYTDQGFAIVGIACEKLPPDEAKAQVKQFVEESKIPYACVMGDEATQDRVPELSGFPTSLILDETGKVRFRSMGAQEGEGDAIEDAVIVLLDEMKTKKAAAKTP